VKQLDSTGLKRLHRGWRRRSERRLALLLDGLGTPVNVGSIVRSAAAYGVERLWVAGTGPDPLSPGAQKTALGTDRYVPWERVEKGADAVIAAHETGFTVVGLELAEGAVPLHELALGDAVCVAVGHEDHGLARTTLDACDVLAYLPLVGRVGSLNVAVAAAIALAEARRQEWAASDPQRVDLDP
jgi:tRNA (guanosine-2'-O-)-methyltransferase